VYAKIGYALSWATRIKDGLRYFPRYDMRHSLNALVGLDLGSGWQTSATWTMHTGMPFTPIAGYYDRVSIDPWTPPYDYGTQDPATIWGKRNSSRLPVYHRLDMGVTRQLRVAGANVTAGLSILNIYDRKNIFYFDRDTGKEVYMLRILPSASLRIEL